MQCSSNKHRQHTQQSETWPILPFEELIPFIEHYFGRKIDYLACLKNQPSPVYVFEPEMLKQRAAHFQKAFRSRLTDSSFFFAVKSNNHPKVAETLLKFGFGLDVSSGVELKTALDLNAQKIIFSGPGKTKEEIELAVRHNSRITLLLDSFGELQRLEKTAAKQNRIVRAGVRLTTNPNGLWRKFGIPPEQLIEYWKTSLSCAHVALQGIQFHTSWNLTASPQENCIGMLGRLLSEMPETFIKSLSFIDVGGGYWPQEGEWLHPLSTQEEKVWKMNKNILLHCRRPAESIEVFAEKIYRAIQQHIFSKAACSIYFEPGRWICNDCMHLLMTVVDRKTPDLIITDAGTNAIGWERFETDYFPVLNLTRPALTERPCYILGSLCTPHDVWGYSYFGKDIQVGDVLMIPAQGAYTYSFRQQFIKPIPQVVVLT